MQPKHDPDFSPRASFFTKDSIWVNLPVMLGIIAAVLAVDRMISRIQHEMKLMDTRMDNRFVNLQQALEITSGDRWRLSHQREWSHEMKRDNPELKVPDPDSIATRIK